MKEEKNYRDPNVRLQSALETLERFTQQHKSKKGIRFVAETIFRKRERDEQDTLLNALDDVKRYHSFADPEIEEKTDETIHQFNAIIANAKSWSRAARLKSHTIELQNHPQKGVEKISRKMVADTITEREADAFRMKAISLIKDRTPSIFSTVRKAPIYIDPDQNDVIALHLSLSPFPWETVIIKGAFHRNENGMTIPIADSFQIFSESIQTGFPHPSQHNGWALADPLIPESPHRLDKLPLLSELLKRKKRAAKELMPGGSYLERAKELLKQKTIDLARHRQFCEATTVEELIQTYESINETLIIRPYQKLMEAWKKKSDPELLSNNPEKVYEAAKGIFENERKKGEKSLPEFGKKIGEASQAIILQHLSEVMEFSPPTLTTFEKKVQLCAYFQLRSFLDELEGGEAIATLEREMNIFNQSKVEDPLIKELETYYSTRASSRNNSW